MQVPATVQAVLAARIDRLPPEEKRLLQTAAVIGTEVPLPLLQAIADLPEEALHRGLAHLQAAEFLYETRLFPEREYTFKHALTHEVAYGSLLQERRRALHARIVEALEALAADRVAEQVERLAHHALRGEVWDKALVYCRQAGEKAMARVGLPRGRGVLRAGARRPRRICRSSAPPGAGHRPPARPALGAPAVWRLWAYPRHACARPRPWRAALDDPRRLGQVSRFLVVHFSPRASMTSAIAAAQRALALAMASGDGVLQALANHCLGMAYQAQGDYRRAIDCLRQTVAFLDGSAAPRALRAAHPARRAISRALLAWCHAELGTFAEGRPSGTKGCGSPRRSTHPVSLMCASWGIGLLALRQGDLPQAIPLLERAMALCQDAGPPALFPGWRRPWGAYTLAGRVADAVPLLTQALDADRRRTEAVGYQALCRLCPGGGAAAGWPPGGGAALAEQPSTLARTHQERGNQAYALRLLGEIAARREPPELEQAEAHYRQALALAERTRHAPAPGPLPPRPGHAVCRDWPAGAGPCRARRRRSRCIRLWR